MVSICIIDRDEAPFVLLQRSLSHTQYLYLRIFPLCFKRTLSLQPLVSFIFEYFIAFTFEQHMKRSTGPQGSFAAVPFLHRSNPSPQSLTSSDPTLPYQHFIADAKNEVKHNIALNLKTVNQVFNVLLYNQNDDGLYYQKLQAQE